MTQSIATLSLIVFIAAMLAVGIYSMRRANTVDGFLLGGRKIGPWISAFAYGTSYFSAVIFIGYAGMHGWRIGLASIWIGVGNAVIGCLLAWIILARRTRRMTQGLGSKTMPEFFARRYSSRGMKIYAAVIIFVFLVPYAASVYKGLGSLFSAVFPGASQVVCMAIVAVLTAVYLVLGGYVATTLNDFIQGLIIIVGVIVMVATLLARPEVGGLVEAISRLQAIDPGLTDPLGGDSLGFLVINIALTSFGVLGLPQMVHKYYAIRDEQSIRKATVISTGFAGLIGVGAYLTGSLGRLFLPATAEGLPDLAGGYDAVVPALLMKVFSESVWGNMVLSVILLLLLSASMSTLAAIVLTSSSAVSVDLLGECRPKWVEEGRQMPILRGLCFLFVLASFLFACMDISFIVDLMSFSWGVVAGCFIGPFIWGLYVRRITPAGAWAGLLSGIVVVGGSVAVLTATRGFAAAKALAPEMGVAAMAVSVLAVPLVSLFTRRLPREQEDAVFATLKAPAAEDR